jgi:urease accessory protein UreF
VSGKVLLVHRFFSEEPEMMQNMKSKMGSNVIKSIKRIEGRYAEELQRGIESQEFRPHQTEIIAAALMAMLHNLSAGQIFRTHLDEKQIVSEVLEMVLKGIANTEQGEA